MTKKEKRTSFPGIAPLLLILFGIAALGWQLAGGPAEPAAEEAPPAAAEASVSPQEEDAAQTFAELRMERQKARDDELNLLDEVIADSNSSPGVAESAEERRLAISSYMEQETTAEKLLAAKGYGETVVILSQTGATVIIDREIDQQDAAVIADTVDKASGCGFPNVVIVNK